MDTIADAAAFFEKEIITDERLREREKGPDGNNHGLFEYDGEVDLNNATTDEVAQVVWMNREQIKKLFEQKVIVGTLEYFFTEVDKK